MRDLRHSLVDYDMAMLRALAQNRGVSLSTNLHGEAIEQLVPALLDPLSVRMTLARLSPEALAALEELLRAGGRMPALQFTRAFGEVRPVGPGRLERELLWQSPKNASEELWYAGLVYRAFGPDRGGPVEFFFVPDDLVPLLPSPGPGQVSFAVEVLPAPRQPVPARGRLVHDLFAYLVTVHNRDVRPYADGRLGRRDTAALKARLADAEPRRLAFVRHLAGRLGLTVQQGAYLRLDPAATRGWLTASPGRQLAVLQETWQADPTWIDLCRVPALACDDESGWLRTYETVASRQAILALLARCPTDNWWALDSFVAAVRATQPDFQRPNGDYMSMYIREAGGGAYLSGFESWDAVEGRLIADLLSGVLSWLEVVEVLPTDAGPACRLTPAGASFLGLAPSPPEPGPAPPIVVHADFRVEVPAPENLYTRFQLERFADLEREFPCFYRLSVGGLARALGRGVQVEQILAFLRQAAGGNLPPNVAGEMRLWAGRYGQVELEELVLLKARSERVLKELSVLPETRPFIARLLSPTSALVRKQDLARLRRALEALGFLAPPPPLDDSEEPG